MPEPFNPKDEIIPIPHKPEIGVEDIINQMDENELDDFLDEQERIDEEKRDPGSRLPN